MGWIDDVYHISNIRRIKKKLNPLQQKEIELSHRVDEIRVWLIRSAEEEFGVANIENILWSENGETLKTKQLLLDKKIEHQQVKEKIKKLKAELNDSKREIGVL
jgi:hypothetical protein